MAVCHLATESLRQAEDGSFAQVRLAGDRYVLVEYGPMELDLNLRVRVWALQQYLIDKQASVPTLAAATQHGWREDALISDPCGRQRPGDGQVQRQV